MSSYKVSQASQTACNVIVGSILAGQVLADMTGGIEGMNEWPQQLQPSYQTMNNPSSFGGSSIFDVLTSASSLNQEFAAFVTDFYADLLNHQQLLGKEFEKVLHDNLASLYEA